MICSVSFKLARHTPIPVVLSINRFATSFGRWLSIFYGEFDPGSGRTLAACLTHASRTMKPELALVD